MCRSRGQRQTVSANSLGGYNGSANNCRLPGLFHFTVLGKLKGIGLYQSFFTPGEYFSFFELPLIKFSFFLRRKDLNYFKPKNLKL
jgi:hypothetical protein